MCGALSLDSVDTSCWLYCVVSALIVGGDGLMGRTKNTDHFTLFRNNRIICCWSPLSSSVASATARYNAVPNTDLLLYAIWMEEFMAGQQEERQQADEYFPSMHMGLG